VVGERVCYDVANRVKKGASWIASPLDVVLSLNTNQINDRVAGIEKVKQRAKDLCVVLVGCWRLRTIVMVGRNLIEERTNEMAGRGILILRP
jgi:hypothetical protein